MRLVIIVATVLAGCGPPSSAPVPEHDATTDVLYTQATEQLATLNRAAEGSFKSGKADEAAALIQKGEPLASQLLAVPRPTLAAMEAASDLDDLYGRMLLANRHYEWAQFLFQKCLARWKYWKPQTPETERRLKLAEAAIAECDRGMAKRSPPPSGRK